MTLSSSANGNSCSNCTHRIDRRIVTEGPTLLLPALLWHKSCMVTSNETCSERSSLCRCIQVADQPIILTGFSALNKLLGREVYSSQMQLGGPKVVACSNPI